MANKRQNENQKGQDESRDQGQTALDRPSTSRLSSRESNYPFGLLRRFANEIDDLFGDVGFGRSFGLNRPGMWASGFDMAWPQIDMFEADGQFVIRADVPGLKKEDLHVEVMDNELTISGERKDEREEHKGGFYRSERSYGRFERHIALPEGTNIESVSSSFNNGILEIKRGNSSQARTQHPDSGQGDWRQVRKGSVVYFRSKAGAGRPVPGVPSVGLCA